MEIPHKCNVINAVKVSNTKTNLVCCFCGKVIGVWDDCKQSEMPKNARYLCKTERELLR